VGVTGVHIEGLDPQVLRVFFIIPTGCGTTVKWRIEVQLGLVAMECELDLIMNGGVLFIYTCFKTLMNATRQVKFIAVFFSVLDL